MSGRTPEELREAAYDTDRRDADERWIARLASEEKAWRVVWDNGASACGTFPDRFDSEEEAEEFGRDWAWECNVRDFGTPEPEEGYTYEVIEETRG